MNQRDIFILRAALIYFQSNLDDANMAFEADDADEISVNGDVAERIEEDELEQLLYRLQ